MTNLTLPESFFNTIRSGDLLGPVLSSTEVAGLNSIVGACGDAKWGVAWTAYALATAYLETAHTMQPIKEMGGNEYLRRCYDVTGHQPDRAKKYGNVVPGDGVKFCGRGYVMATWHDNYARAQRETGVPFLQQPDLMLDPVHAAKVMVLGMGEGWFSGRSLGHYLPDSGLAPENLFVAARAVINGTDRAGDIAHYALKFQRALVDGGWQ